MTRRFIAVLGTGVLLAPAAGLAYPGGTPDYQTNAAPFCAGCHASRSVEMLAGAGERAEKEVVDRKHLAVILEGKKGYADLSDADRATLADQIRALDAASTVKLEAPTRVARGQSFQVTVSVTGGAGPVVGVALVDRDHRWYARPAAAAGWAIAGPPVILGSDGQPQNGWLAKRPDGLDRNLSFVNVTGIESDSAQQKWARKSTVLGYTTNAVGWKEVRCGLGGASGRVLFTPVQSIAVE
jgi:cytochrome c553